MWSKYTPIGTVVTLRNTMTSCNIILISLVYMARTEDYGIREYTPTDLDFKNTFINRIKIIDPARHKKNSGSMINNIVRFPSLAVSEEIKRRNNISPKRRRSRKNSRQLNKKLEGSSSMRKQDILNSSQSVSQSRLVQNESSYNNFIVPFRVKRLKEKRAKHGKGRTKKKNGVKRSESGAKDPAEKSKNPDSRDSQPIQQQQQQHRPIQEILHEQQQQHTDEVQHQHQQPVDEVQQQHQESTPTFLHETPIEKVDAGLPVYHVPKSEDVAEIPDVKRPCPPECGINPYEVLTSSSLNGTVYNIDHCACDEHMNHDSHHDELDHGCPCHGSLNHAEECHGQHEENCHHYPSHGCQCHNSPCQEEIHHEECIDHHQCHPSECHNSPCQEEIHHEECITNHPCHPSECHDTHVAEDMHHLPCHECSDYHSGHPVDTHQCQSHQCQFPSDYNRECPYMHHEECSQECSCHMSPNTGCCHNMQEESSYHKECSSIHVPCHASISHGSCCHGSCCHGCMDPSVVCDSDDCNGASFMPRPCLPCTERSPKGNYQVKIKDAFDTTELSMKKTETFSKKRSSAIRLENTKRTFPSSRVKKNKEKVKKIISSNKMSSAADPGHVFKVYTGQGPMRGGNFGPEVEEVEKIPKMPLPVKYKQKEKEEREEEEKPKEDASNNNNNGTTTATTQPIVVIMDGRQTGRLHAHAHRTTTEKGKIRSTYNASEGYHENGGSSSESEADKLRDELKSKEEENKRLSAELSEKAKSNDELKTELSVQKENYERMKGELSTHGHDDLQPHDHDAVEEENGHGKCNCHENTPIAHDSAQACHAHAPPEINNIIISPDILKEPVRQSLQGHHPAQLRDGGHVAPVTSNTYSFPSPIRRLESGYPVFNIPPTNPEVIIPEYHKPLPPLYGVNPYEVLTSSELNGTAYKTEHYSPPNFIPMQKHCCSCCS